MKWLNRIIVIIATVFLSSTITFAIIRLMPGNPVTTMAMDIQRNEGISLEDATIRAKGMLNFDPDVPLHLQYANYIKGVLSGNFGNSMIFKQPVMHIIGSALTWTLFISTGSLFFAFIIGSAIGMYIAWKRKSILDPLITTWDALIGAMPPAIIAFLLIIVFSSILHWFPSRGQYNSNLMPGFNLPFILSALHHAVLPTCSWVLTSVGAWALNMKAMSVTTLGEDYLTSARARGLRDGRIIFTYVGRNALLPQVTALAAAFAATFAGSALIEFTFVYPGIGYFFSKAISTRDYTLMQGIFLTITLAVVIANQLADAIYSFIDPRVREGR